MILIAPLQDKKKQNRQQQNKHRRNKQMINVEFGRYYLYFSEHFYYLSKYPCYLIGPQIKSGIAPQPTELNPINKSAFVNK